MSKVLSFFSPKRWDLGLPESVRTRLRLHQRPMGSFWGDVGRRTNQEPGSVWDAVGIGGPKSHQMWRCTSWTCMAYHYKLVEKRHGIIMEIPQSLKYVGSTWRCFPGDNTYWLYFGGCTYTRIVDAGFPVSTLPFGKCGSISMMDIDVDDLEI